MLKLKKEKILVSLIAIVMIALVVGNVCSLATDDSSNSTGLQLTSSGNTNKSSNNTVANNEVANIGTEVGSTNSTKNNTVKNNTTNTNTNTNSTKNNTSTNSASSKLPYAGSNTSIIFVVIALGASAIYAYKKVSDYNV